MSREVQVLAENYYRQVGIRPSFEDFIGYLQMNGDFTNYKEAQKLYEKVVEAVFPCSDTGSESSER